MIDPITMALVKKINEKAQDALKQKQCYRLACPECGKKLVKEILLKEGCFGCGWKPIEENKIIMNNETKKLA